MLHPAESKGANSQLLATGNGLPGLGRAGEQQPSGTSDGTQWGGVSRGWHCSRRVVSRGCRVCRTWLVVALANHWTNSAHGKGHKKHSCAAAFGRRTWHGTDDGTPAIGMSSFPPCPIRTGSKQARQLGASSKPGVTAPAARAWAGDKGAASSAATMGVASPSSGEEGTDKAARGGKDMKGHATPKGNGAAKQTETQAGCPRLLTSYLPWGGPPDAVFLYWTAPQ